MATYPVEFHRRLEQKWESRIEQILSVTGFSRSRVKCPHRDVPMMTVMMTSSGAASKRPTDRRRTCRMVRCI
jgi:hypothetical protein